MNNLAKGLIVCFICLQSIANPYGSLIKQIIQQRRSSKVVFPKLRSSLRCITKTFGVLAEIISSDHHCELNRMESLKHSSYRQYCNLLFKN